MKVQLELTRLEQLQEVMGTELPEIVRGILESMRSAIGQVEAALASDQLERAAKAAHACRNDAMIIGARQLLDALTELEHAARAGRGESARGALVNVRQIWPGTQEELQRVAGRAI